MKSLTSGILVILFLSGSEALYCYTYDSKLGYNHTSNCFDNSYCWEYNRRDTGLLKKDCSWVGDKVAAQNCLDAMLIHGGMCYKCYTDYCNNIM